MFCFLSKGFCISWKEIFIAIFIVQPPSTHQNQVLWCVEKYTKIPDNVSAESSIGTLRHPDCTCVTHNKNFMCQNCLTLQKNKNFLQRVRREKCESSDTSKVNNRYLNSHEVQTKLKTNRKYRDRTRSEYFQINHKMK